MSLNNETAKELFSRSRIGYSKAEVKSIGKSWLSRDIFCSAIGHGDRNIVIVGGFCGGDIPLSSFLADFSHELDNCVTLDRRIAEFKVSSLCSGSKIHIIPVMNPDGLVLNGAGISADNPFYGRVTKMMRGSDDFNEWCANIRGVQLAKNFNYKWIDGKLRERNLGIFSGAPFGYGGEYPESELETSSLCAYCRKISPDIVIEFRLDSETNISPFVFNDSAEKTRRAARLIYGYTGIPVSEDENIFYGSFAGWAAKEFSCSSVVLNCNKDFTDKTASALKSAVLLFCAQ